jgi:hypothetical protein
MPAELAAGKLGRGSAPLPDAIGVQTTSFTSQQLCAVAVCPRSLRFPAMQEAGQFLRLIDSGSFDWI